MFGAVVRANRVRGEDTAPVKVKQINKTRGNSRSHVETGSRGKQKDQASRVARAKLEQYEDRFIVEPMITYRSKEERNGRRESSLPFLWSRRPRNIEEKHIAIDAAYGLGGMLQ